MTDFDKSQDEKDERELAAALWCMRLHGDEAESLRLEFDTWLRADPRNLQAYNETEEVYLLGGPQTKPRKLEVWPNSPPMSRPGSMWAWSLPIVGIVIAAALLFFLLAAYPRPKPEAPAAIRETEVDQSRQDLTTQADGCYEELADGSHVRLAPYSRLQIRFSAEARQLTLLAGRGRFEVAHESRPFIVSAGGGKVTARGTIFDVRLSSARRVEVKLIQGNVDVELPHQQGAAKRSAPHRMKAGDLLSFETAAPVGQLSTLSLDADVPNRMTVGDLIAQANGAAGNVRISLADPTLAASSVSGQFQVHDAATVADRLATIFDLEVDRSQSGLLVLRRRL